MAFSKFIFKADEDETLDVGAKAAATITEESIASARNR